MRYLILRTGYIFWSTSVGFCFFCVAFDDTRLFDTRYGLFVICVPLFSMRLLVTPPPLRRYLDYSLFSLKIWVNGHHDIKTIKTPILGETNE